MNSDETRCELDIAAHEAYQNVLEAANAESANTDDEFDFDECQSVTTKGVTIESCKGDVIGGSLTQNSSKDLLDSINVSNQGDTLLNESGGGKRKHSNDDDILLPDNEGDTIQLQNDGDTHENTYRNISTDILIEDEATEEFAEVSFHFAATQDKTTKSTNKSVTEADEVSIKRVSFDEALQHFDGLDLNEYADRIKPRVQHSGLALIWRSLIGPPKLAPALTTERNLVFTLALVGYEKGNNMHWSILRTIYQTLTRSKLPCKRYGSHWQQIGFQGDDPSTDLRGCGMLGLLTTLSFTTTTSTAALARQVYLLSTDEVQNFPFAVMSINVTRMALQILREEKLNKECNRRLKQCKGYQASACDMLMYTLFQDVYIAIFHRIFTVWKNGNKTMAESGFVLKEVEDSAKANPVRLLNEFESLRRDSKSKYVSDDSSKISSFVGIEDL